MQAFKCRPLGEPFKTMGGVRMQCGDRREFEGEWGDVHQGQEPAAFNDVEWAGKDQGKMQTCRPGQVVKEKRGGFEQPGPLAGSVQEIADSQAKGPGC